MAAETRSVTTQRRIGCPRSVRPRVATKVASISSQPTEALASVVGWWNLGRVYVDALGSTFFHAFGQPSADLEVLPADAEFVAHLEQVLNIYVQPYDPTCPTCEWTSSRCNWSGKLALRLPPRQRGHAASTGGGCRAPERQRTGLTGPTSIVMSPLKVDSSSRPPPPPATPSIERLPCSKTVTGGPGRPGRRRWGWPSADRR